MPFSVLLLTGVSSKRHITGAKNSRVSMPSILSDEVALFFDKLDESPARSVLGLTEKCCDGIIFYANENQKAICLVEMKNANLGLAKEQLMQTYDRLHSLLKKECSSCSNYLESIFWQAYIYHSGSSLPGGYRNTENDLKGHGFKEAWVRSDPDISQYLRMQVGATLRNQRSRKHGH
jgi:hypothetical protein